MVEISGANEEVAHTLRLLEIIGRANIPVVPGAAFPLVRSRNEAKLWQQPLALGLAAVFSGSVIVPLLLPWIPFRAFTAKGWLVGALVNGALLHGAGLARGMDPYRLVACWIFFPAAAAALALSFTGATTFTSPSGVRREVTRAIPIFAAAAILTIAALVLSKLEFWGSL